MGDRSSSGVRGIRAMFEAKGENTSPPSRGRSPVGSEGVRSTSSRPLSKVRTSFVTVERSGLLGPVIGLRKMSDTGDAVPRMGNGTNGDTSSLNKDQVAPGQHVEAIGESFPGSTLNGVQVMEIPENVKRGEIEGNLNFDGPSSSLEPVDKVEPEALASQNTKTDTNGIANPTPIALKTTAEDSAAAPSDNIEDLGHVLKGSSFEPEDSTASQTLTLPENGAASKSPENKNKNSVTPGHETVNALSNGKPVRSSKSAADPKSLSNRPAAISTKGVTPQGPKSSQPQSAGNGIKSAKPNTPKTPITTSQNASSKTSSPRQPLGKTNSPRQTLPGKSTSRVSTGISTNSPISSAPKTSLEPFVGVGKTRYSSKPLTSDVVSSKRVTSTSSLKQPHGATAATSEAKKPTTASSALPKKPTPKSPTRPARLPAAATAPTAASAAKLGANSSVHPSNATSTIGTSTDRKSSTQKKDRLASGPRVVPAASAVQGLQKKSSRPSLPTSSHLADRPKSRASTVGSKPPDEGFLARMMRPTASSASKAHEKFEPKSPPRKASTTKSKRKSEISEEEKSKLSEDEPKTKGADDIPSHESIEEGTELGKGLVNGTGSTVEPIST
ncbi:hypothetical protein MMC34_003972 [Xylographa carneopallida]|nr:hypothetical protein [Xylographa carneopallida]